MAISMNNVKTNVEVKGFAAVNRFRDQLVKALYKETIVINKIEVEGFNEETNEYKLLSKKYGTIGCSPVVKAFGLNREYKRSNVPVEIELDNDTRLARKVNIDGEKYIYCDNLLIVKCEEKETIERLDRDGIEYNGALYRVLGASPSQEKHAVKMFFRVTNKMPNERAAFEMMDEISGYVFTRGLFVKEHLSGKDVAKANTRWGNYMTNMLKLAEIDLTKDYIVVIDGSIDGACDVSEETNEEMKAAGIEIDNNINDGAMYFSTGVVKEIANNVDVKLTNKDALKVALQVRVSYLTSKCMSRTLTDEQLKVLAKLPNAKIYGNTTGKLMCVVDTDGAKLLNTTDLENGTAKLAVNVMAMAKASEPKTSGQHLIKYMFVNPEETLKLINKMTMNNLAQYTMNQVDENVQGVTTIDQVKKGLGQEAFTNRALVEDMIKEDFTYIQSAIAKCKLSIPALYSHMMFDASFALSNGTVNGVLSVTEDGMVEAYSADILRKYSAEIAEIENNAELTKEQKDEQLFNLLSGIVIKYPSAGPKEYEIVVYLTYNQIIDRIEKQVYAAVAKLDMRNEDKIDYYEYLVEMLTKYFNNTPYGTTVYAPLNAMKNKLAGADCDFDATMTDMSELKYILIDQRRKEQESKPGFMGDCTFISYKGSTKANKKQETQAVKADANDNSIF